MMVSGVRGVHAVRSDGGLVHIRPVVPADLEQLRALHAQSSDRSRYRRFLGFGRALGADYSAKLARPSTREHRALAGLVGGGLVGVAAFERVNEQEAEISLLVRDEMQHRGIGTLLLEHLTVLARAEGIRRFTADVLSENAAMIEVFHDLGLPVSSSVSAGVISAVVDLAAGQAVLAATGERDRSAAAASMRSVLAPVSIAVIGASARPNAVGHQVLRNIVDGGFAGVVYAVNPHRQDVLGVPCFASVDLLPTAPELAIIAIPAGQVRDSVESCGRRGVHSLLVLSAGFSETDASGRGRQAEIVELARHHGMRMVGPNCLGVLNTDPTVRLNATFATLPMTPGALSLVSQSGALGVAVLEAAARCGLNVAQFVSVGNKADVSSNDLLLAWEHDERTRVIAMYLESFGNPRRFARIARRVAARKPIIAIKAGRSAAGQLAGRSHTAAAAASDTVVDALFTQAGVVRVATMQQLLDSARILSGQPLPAGPRVAIIGNSGGPGILAADAAEASGLTVVPLQRDTQRSLRLAAPTAASTENPVDLGAAADPVVLAAALDVVLAADEVDAVITVVTDTAVVDPEQMMSQIARAAAGTGKTLIATRVGSPACSVPLPGASGSLPVFTFPEPAAAALACAERYARIRSAPIDTAERPAGLDMPGAAALVGRTLGTDTDTGTATATGWLPPDDVAELLSCYRIPVCPQRIVDNEEAAVRAGAELGYPLAAKAAAAGAHKTEIGGVHLGITDQAELRTAFGQLTAIQGPDAKVLLQPMMPEGIEIIIGAIQDHRFGPLVMVGAGGVLADLIADRSFRLAPVSRAQAGQMLGELRTSALLDGYRGRPAVPRASVIDVIARVAALADDLPDIAELDLNPVICTPDGLTVVDARIRLEKPGPAYQPLLRALP